MSDFLADLERELVTGYRRGRRRRTARRAVVLAATVGVAAVVVPAVGGGGQARTGATERPAAPPHAGRLGAAAQPGPPDHPTRSTAVRSASLLPVRVADPDGGPPWGLRKVVRRTGLVCVQYGRVQGGRLGTLGVDGGDGDDGAFHPLPAFRADDCQPPDAAGHTFLATRVHGIPKSATWSGCQVHDERDFPAGAPRPTPVADPCPRADVRIVNYGLLGPDAQSITYKGSDKQTVQEPVSRPDGGFLVVRRPLPVDEVSPSFSPGAVPVRQTFSSVRYDDGTECRLKPVFADGRNRCPARGYAAPTDPIPTAAQVHAPVHVSARRGTLHGEALYRVTVRFRARYAARDGAHYVLGMGAHRANGRPCSGYIEGAVRHDVRVGGRVRNVFWFPLSCRTASGSVDYQPAPRQPTGDPFYGDPQDRVNVGRPRVRLP